MKILMLTDRYPPELRSSAALFHDLARALQARSHEVRVITKVPSKYTPPDGGTGRKESKNGWKDVEGVPVRRVRWVPYLRGGRAVRALDHLTLWLAFSFAGREWPQAPNATRPAARNATGKERRMDKRRRCASISGGNGPPARRVPGNATG